MMYHTMIVHLTFMRSRLCKLHHSDFDRVDSVTRPGLNGRGSLSSSCSSSCSLLSLSSPLSVSTRSVEGKLTVDGTKFGGSGRSLTEEYRDLLDLQN